MERVVPMPKLGMTMTVGIISHWRVALGDVVAKDDVLAEVETDKVELEVESPAAGHVLRLLAKEGDTIPVGQPLMVLEVADDAKLPRQITPAAETAATAPALATAAPAPQVSGNGAAALARARIPSTPAARRLAQERNVPLALVAESVRRDLDMEPLRAQDVEMYGAQPAAAVQRSGAHTLTPLARKMVEAHELSEAAVAAFATTSQGQRLGRAVVAQALAAKALDEHERNGQMLAGALAAAGSPATREAQGQASSEELLPLSGMRRVIADRMTHSFTTAPHIYLDTEVDMTEAERLRASLEKTGAKRGEPVPSVTALLTRVVGVALRQHPRVNAGFTPGVNGQKAMIRRWSAVHVGVAVALPDGLVTPVVRNADRKTLAEIHAELATLAQRAREGKLSPDDYQGGTFTISNLGMYGIDTFHAILNEPQAAILAIGKTVRRPSVITDAHGHESIEIRSILKLSLSADHRALDGADGAKFLTTVRELLENPYLLV